MHYKKYAALKLLLYYTTITYQKLSFALSSDIFAGVNIIFAPFWGFRPVTITTRTILNFL